MRLRRTMTATPRLPSLAVLVALAAAACSTLPPATLGPSGPIAARAASQRLVWSSQNIRSYTFSIERQCLCPEDVRGPFDVTVVEGGATHVRYQGGVAVADRIQNLPKTMEALFELVLANVATEPDIVYDDRFGFPLRVALDPMKNAIDDEVTYVVSNFHVRPAP